MQLQRVKRLFKNLENSNGSLRVVGGNNRALFVSVFIRRYSGCSSRTTQAREKIDIEFVLYKVSDLLLLRITKRELRTHAHRDVPP